MEGFGSKGINQGRKTEMHEVKTARLRKEKK